MTQQIQLRLDFQESPVADEVSAITAVVRPILTGILYALKQDVAREAGGYDNLKLHMLGRLRRPGSGDVGICFEYAIHDALITQNAAVTERVSDALRLCRCPGSEIASILFGAEKNGALNLINAAKAQLNDDSELLYGTRGRPVKLRRHIDSVASAFRRPAARDALPTSISGLWKADLFAGHRDTDKWIGTTVKVSRSHLEGGRGLRVGIVPADEGESDSVRRDPVRNLIVCPIPYDRSFMQVFYQAWQVVVQFLTADAKVPPPASLPRPPSREVARYLEDRRDYPVVEVLSALDPLSQPGLLRTEEKPVDIVETRKRITETTTAVLAPVPSLACTPLGSPEARRTDPLTPDSRLREGSAGPVRRRKPTPPAHDSLFSP